VQNFVGEDRQSAHMHAYYYWRI